MDAGKALFIQIWDALSITALLLSSSAGVLLGLLLGLALALLLQRRGWLGRRNRWHHGLLKLYFLALPGVGALLGLEAGLLWGVQQQLNRQVDAFEPQLQQLAQGYRDDFQAYLRQQPGGLDLQQHGADDWLAQQVRQYLQAQPLAAAGGEATLLQQAAAGFTQGLRESLLLEMAGTRLLRTAASQGGLDRSSGRALAEASFAELLSADFVQTLVKRQLGRLLHGFYLGLVLQGLGLVLLIGLEIGLSWRLGQLRPRQPGLVVAA